MHPEVGHLAEMEHLAEVDQREDVLLEAAAAEANTGIQEFVANPRVSADGAGHFADVGAGGLADGRDGINAGDALGQERVGCLE
jgi:hypothetical protein